MLVSNNTEVHRMSRFLLALAAGASLIAAPAVAHDHKAKGAKGNIVGIASSSPDHKTLVAAVKAADLVSTLASGGPFTVFAPTDAAFTKLPAGTVDTLLLPANKSSLQQVLTYHVVSGKVTASQLISQIQAGGGKASLTTVEGSPLVATVEGGKVVLTDEKGGKATVVATDLAASNGVVHVTDAVSIPS